MSVRDKYIKTHTFLRRQPAAMPKDLSWGVNYENRIAEFRIKTTSLRGNV